MWRGRARSLANYGWSSLSDQPEPNSPRQILEKQLHFAANCRPSGYATSAKTKSGQPVKVRACRRSTVCPWCWARETAGFSYLVLARAVDALPSVSDRRLGVYSTTRVLHLSLGGRGADALEYSPETVYRLVGSIIDQFESRARPESEAGLLLAAVYPYGHSTWSHTLLREKKPEKSVGPVVAASYGYTLRSLVLSRPDSRKLPGFTYSRLDAKGYDPLVRAASRFARYPSGLWRAKAERLAPFLSCRSKFRLFSTWGDFSGLANRNELAGLRCDDGFPAPKSIRTPAAELEPD